MKKFYILTICFMSLGMLSRAQLTSVTIEPVILHEEAIGNADIIPAGAITYHIYANFSNEADYLSAVYGDASCSLQITSTETIFQSSVGSHLVGSVNPSLFSIFPELEYDSFVTIGKTNSEDPGSTVYSLEGGGSSWIGAFEDGGNILIEGDEGGLWFVLNEINAENAVAGTDLAILIAQITTTGELSGQANFQVFENGEITNVVEVSCIPHTEASVIGCIDPEACNYDELANLDDGSCMYPEEFYDCEGNCINDSDEDGICDELELEGCTDPEACNYNPEVTEDDDSCIYPEEFYDCEGNCINDTDEDGICDELEIEGCTDPEACNYNPEATEEDDSCIYPEEFYDCEGDCINDTDEDGICDELETEGCTDPEACNYNSEATEDDGSCEACLLIPTGFTPNNDGFNDTWIIQGSENYPEINVEIFNRWGQSLYSSRGYEEPWNGIFEGNRVAMASYYYVITLEPGSEPLTGFFTIKY
jgi:gliding motility-associated-like protein